MINIIHFWGVSGGFGLRYEMLSSLILKKQGHLHVISSLRLFVNYWNDRENCENNKLVFFSSMVLPFLVLIRLRYPREKFIYFVRGDELREALCRKRYLRYCVGYLFQILMRRLINPEYIFVSWDLEQDYVKRFGLVNTLVLPNSIGEKLPRTRSFDGEIAVVGDFCTVKDVEWVIDELKDSKYVIHLYGNKEKLTKLEFGNLKCYGVVNDLKEHLKSRTLLVISSKSEGYPNILNEALEVGCAVLVHSDFPFRLLPMCERWKFRKERGELLNMLKNIEKTAWSYDEDNRELRLIVESDWVLKVNKILWD